MGNDLPDFQSQVIGVGLEATSFRSGLDTDKPASPAAGDIWLARDTYYLYVCNVAGSWEKVAKLYLPLAGGTMSGAIAMGSNKVTGLATPTDANDAARKTDVDTVDAKLDDVSVAQPSRAMDTVYQNSTKLRLVLITGVASSSTVPGFAVKIGSSSPPGTTIGAADVSATSQRASISFLVPPSWYYVAYQTNMTVYSWTEWDLF